MGFLAGCVVMYLAFKHDLSLYESMQACREAEFYARVLNHLRDGTQAKALVYLEEQLDLSLIATASDPGCRNDLGMNFVRGYRTKYPWQSANPEIRTLVQKALSTEK